MDYKTAKSWLVGCGASVLEIVGYGVFGSSEEKGCLLKLSKSIGVFKKVYFCGGPYRFNEGIANLIIPEDTLVVLTARDLYHKARAERAIVHSIFDIAEFEIKKAYANYDRRFKYETGVTVKTRRAFDPDPAASCSSGLHFYCNLQLALNH